MLCSLNINIVVFPSENIKKRCTPSTERIFGKLRAANSGPVTKNRLSYNRLSKAGRDA
jgi:hypothetical protein